MIQNSDQIVADPETCFSANEEAREWDRIISDLDLTRSCLHLCLSNGPDNRVQILDHNLHIARTYQKAVEQFIITVGSSKDMREKVTGAIKSLKIDV